MPDKTRDPEAIHFKDAGSVPNNRLPLLVYRAEFGTGGDSGARWLERTFASNGWRNSWRNGVYGYHHYHTNTHEVLGVYQGRATLHMGGESGMKLDVGIGDVIVIPAGVGHKKVEASADFAVVGAYPGDTVPDLAKDDFPATAADRERISDVPVPGEDPVRGHGGLVRLWKQIPDGNS